VENFSWHEITKDDSDAIVKKKQQINPIQNQHLCGSCWAMSISAVISDCFVVSGISNIKPKISPTYLMMIVPTSFGNNQCNGGNPASVVKALENIDVLDSHCVDYSWCSNDNEMCSSHKQILDIGDKLDEKIPKSKNGACYFSGMRKSYRIDVGSELISISDNLICGDFRNCVKSHIVDFGPVITGFAVLENFVTGNFTLNDGIYFENANYEDPYNIRFDLEKSQLVGFHAVRIVGWGVGKNIQYDTDKYGDVPYWIAANSWGNNWGHMNGYFKMAMYPFNKFAQFGKQIESHGEKVGGMILIRATKPPSLKFYPQLSKHYLDSITKSEPDSYYKPEKEKVVVYGAIVLGVISILFSLVQFLISMNR
jgi:hypothetical protein